MQLGSLSSIYMVIGWRHSQSGRVKVLTVRMPSLWLQLLQLSANNAHLTWVTSEMRRVGPKGPFPSTKAHGCFRARVSVHPVICFMFSTYSPTEPVWKVSKVAVWNELLTPSESLNQTWTWLARVVIHEEGFRSSNTGYEYGRMRHRFHFETSFWCVSAACLHENGVKIMLFCVNWQKLCFLKMGAPAHAHYACDQIVSYKRGLSALM